MSRRAKVVIAASFALAAVATGVWAWFLSGHGLAEASAWSGVLQVFTAFLGIPALGIGLAALWSPSGEGTNNRKSGDQRVKLGRIKAGGSVNVNVHQSTRS